MDAVDEYLKRMVQTVERMSRSEIWTVIEVLYRAWQDDKRVYICGNGGSAATAAHMASDLNKSILFDGKPRMKVFALTDNVPLMTALSNDIGYENIFAEPLKNFLEPGDVVIFISASGNSANILRGVETAHERQAVTIGMTGDCGGKLNGQVDHCVLIPDEYIGRQEDGHMILDHLISSVLGGVARGEIELPIPDFSAVQLPEDHEK